MKLRLLGAIFKRDTMKIEELSIGNWVLSKLVQYTEGDTGVTPPMQIVRIDKGSESVLLSADNGFKLSCHVSDLIPIPITPEILKVNEWVCVEVGDRGPATPKSNFMRFEKWVCRTQWATRFLFFDRMTKRWRFDGMNAYTFSDIHHLQNAMTLSNFDGVINIPCKDYEIRISGVKLI